MTESASYLRSQRNSSSKHKVSRQLFADSPLLSNNKNNRLTEIDQNVYNIQSNTTTSRQFCKAYKKQTTQNSNQKSKLRNQESSDYIRNLYKKYLGKQNNNQTHSERKLRTDIKQNKKTLVTQTYRENDSGNTSCRKQKISSIVQDNQKQQKNIFLKKEKEKSSIENSKYIESGYNVQVQVNPLNLNKHFYMQQESKAPQLIKPMNQQKKDKNDWYNSMLNDNFCLSMISSQGSSILTCLKNIKHFKQNINN